MESKGRVYFTGDITVKFKIFAGTKEEAETMLRDRFRGYKIVSTDIDPVKVIEGDTE